VTRHRVLLIDDSEISLMMVSATLERAGYDVRTSSEPHTVRSALGGWQPDVILTDVTMPGMSGVELCRLLKSTYDTAHVPIVLLSALEPAELEQLASECEADGFLTKVDIDRLPRELARLIETAVF